MFRPRLFQLKDEEELIDYFAQHAGFVTSGVYECAGVMAGDTSDLFQKLKVEWKKDIEQHYNEMRIFAVKLLNK